MRFDAFRARALALPGATEALARGTHSFLVRGTLFARLMEDGETLIVRTDRYERDHLVETWPEVYFVTPSIQDHPWVRLHLGRAEETRLGALVCDAWRRVAPRRLVAAYDAERAS